MSKGGRLPQCITSSQVHNLTPQRRSANYKPNIWEYDFVQSLSNQYTGEIYQRRADKLKEEVKLMLNDNRMVLLAQLELIDDLQRLGMGYLFEEEIKRVLDTVVCSKNNIIRTEDDLHNFYATALRFRLLRQHGYCASQDVFNKFKDETGSFMTRVCVDVKGMLHLYEASHVSMYGENILDEAKAFTSKNLEHLKGNIHPNLAKQVAHALELPLHWRMQWSEARWYINAYERKEQMNPILLELAKLNFNMVQATHQNDLKEITRWWRKEGLAMELSFARDRLVESFLWIVGLVFEPQQRCLRKYLTKVLNLIIIIDDVYDIYGSMDELEKFTDVVDRWDDKEIKHLQDYMKTCFQALYGITAEIASEIQEEQDGNIITHLKKVWADFCKALLVEAKWYNNGYSPTLQEYLNNAWVSSSGSVLLVHAIFALRHKAIDEVVDFLETNQDLVYFLSMIIRLCNDLGTSEAELERGDVPSSILCYMRDAKVSEEIARKHIEGMIIDTWKKMNGKCISQTPLPFLFLNIISNFPPVAQFIYQHGDGYGVQDCETRKNILSLLVEPIVINCNEV